MTALFDFHAASYREQVARAVAFTGKPPEYFAAVKARALVEVIERTLGDPGGVSALDVGCGSGVAHGLLAPLLGRLEGVDPSERMLQAAREANPELTYRSYDGETLPVSDGSFDVAFATCVVHHVPFSARAQFFRELVRVVRPQGLVVVFEHNPLNPLTTRLVVGRIEFDADAVLVGRRRLAELLRGGGATPFEARYLLFLPWSARPFQAIERALRAVPFGAQYYVAARTP